MSNDYAPSMPAVETISIHSITETTYTTTTQLAAAEGAEATVIANMTWNNDSIEGMGTFVQKDPAAITGKQHFCTENKLFDVSSRFLQEPYEIRNPPSNNSVSHTEDTIPESATTVYRISAQDYHDMQVQYTTHPLPPDNVLFPWLHGIDGTNYQQSLFFGVRRMVVPKHRGLVLIHAGDLDTDTGSTHMFDPFRSRLLQSFLIDDITAPATSLNDTDREEGKWVFRQADPKENVGVQLRNFKIQPWRYASISDIVIYGGNAEMVAHRISVAQKHIYRQRELYHQRLRSTCGKRAIVDANDISYRIFLIKDCFDVFETRFPDLVWYDSQGQLVHNSSFLELERKEMREMSRATELTKNVWFGNTDDAPSSMDIDNDSDVNDDDSHSIDTLGSDDNPHSFSVCIECHDLSDMPLPSILTLATETLNELRADELPSEIIHLDMYSTGAVIETSDQVDTFLSNLLHLLRFMDSISQDTAASAGRRILAHCSDGYTETSVLALSWLMYKLRYTLPEAYLYLQQNRSFFVLSTDVPLLRRIEQALKEDRNTTRASILSSPLPTSEEYDHQQQKRKREEMMEPGEDPSASLPSETIPHNTSAFNHGTIAQPVVDTRTTVHEQHTSIILSSSSTNYISHSEIIGDSYQGIHDIDESFLVKVHQNQDHGRKRQLLAALKVPPPSPDEMARYPWFFSPRFEGSFPSRIMPFLYLGNLNHATNPGMLHALGITHIVSVGENANLDQQQFKLLFLDNLYDDGIDSIKMRFDEAMTFLDNAYAQGTKCLIHCRVGVSRSAALTICYIMHHFKTMSLVEAYIFVRARRLNVIIQPNLKFMYEILQLEQYLTGKFRLSWPILCHEIHLLNQTYDDENDEQ